MALDPRELLRYRTRPGTGEAAPSAQVPAAPLGGTRAERIQRLQIGAFGILAMLLLIALADIVISRAQLTEASAVPEAAPTVVASETAASRDPLADAGVVPQLPATPTATPTAQGEPARGDVLPPQPSPQPVQNAPLQ